MFHSQELSKSVSELESMASTFRDKADEISNDIRALEKYLTSKFIGIEVGLNVQDHHIDDAHMEILKLADHAPIGGWLLREFLIWGKDEETQKFRLLYETHSLVGSGNGGYQVRPKRKPLIECSLFDRFRMRSKLALLVDHIKIGISWA